VQHLELNSITIDFREDIEAKILAKHNFVGAKFSELNLVLFLWVYNFHSRLLKKVLYKDLAPVLLSYDTVEYISYVLLKAR
jgi:hypothetical protein